VYLCGPPGMAEASYDALRAAGVPARHIHHESFEL
jgi:ferredoxin-NADP reductase